MNKAKVLKSIFVDNIYGILMNQESEIPWPLNFTHQDRIEFLDETVKILENFEEYSKCSDILKLRRSLQKKYEQASNN
jgi:hypothetical protein